MNPAPLVLMSLKHISFHRLLHLKKEKGKSLPFSLSVPPPPLLPFFQETWEGFAVQSRQWFTKRSFNHYRFYFSGLSGGQSHCCISFLFFSPYTKGTLFVIRLNSGLVCLQVRWGSAGCSLNIAPNLSCFVFQQNVLLQMLFCHWRKGRKEIHKRIFHLFIYLF